jgi:glycosyltransferase involved in cell wall biosynthesis
VTPAVFICCSSPDRGVFESQVLEYGRFMRTLGIDFRYVLFEGLRGWWRDREPRKRRVAQLERDYGVRITVHALPLPLTDMGLRLAGRAVAAAAPAAGPVPLLLQARNPDATCIALEARRALAHAVVVHDARGDVAAEARMTAALASGAAERQRWERRARRLEALERRTCAEADHHLAVSTALGARLVALGARSERVTVVPCCVDPARFAPDAEARQATRERLRLGDRVVLVYAGSLAVWQVPDRIAALVGALHAQIPQVHLLVVTGEREAAEQAFADLVRRGACSIVEARYDDMGTYLAAADAALLLREDHPVNHVASPVKFAEYQAAGLPVIATDGIGDVGWYLRETGHGIVLASAPRHDNDVAAIVRALRAGAWNGQRERIRDAAARRFVRATYRDDYRDMLAALGVASPRPRAVA